MAIPDYQTLMLPLLKLLGDSKERRLRDTYQVLADQFELSVEETQQLLPSGKSRVMNNRVQWAKLYLVRAGLLESRQRGVVRITERGRDLLKESPERIDASTLRRFPEFVEFRETKTDPVSKEDADKQLDVRTPDEMLEQAHQSLRTTLAAEILTQAKQASPVFFEQLVVDLLLGMGYGGSLEDAGRVVGRSGDGGIDGIIEEDRLGLEVIYIQAKRWENVVGRPEIQKFVGALQGKRARKGVFITTSGFTADARNYASSIETKVVLIDGRKLAELMIDFGVGVSTVETYHKKRLDTDYFNEE